MLNVEKTKENLEKLIGLELMKNDLAKEITKCFVGVEASEVKYHDNNGCGFDYRAYIPNSDIMFLFTMNQTYDSIQGVVYQELREVKLVNRRVDDYGVNNIILKQVEVDKQLLPLKDMIDSVLKGSTFILKNNLCVVNTKIVVKFTYRYQGSSINVAKKDLVIYLKQESDYSKMLEVLNKNKYLKSLESLKDVLRKEMNPFVEMF